MLDFLRGKECNPQEVLSSSSTTIKAPHKRGSNRFKSLALAVLLTPGVTSVVAPKNAQALGPNSCQFTLGAAELKNRLADAMGDCIDNGSYGPNGDFLQHTTKGLIAWIKSRNQVDFTDGYMTWLIGPQDNQTYSRKNTDALLAVEQIPGIADPTPQPTPEANPNTPHGLDLSDWPTGDLGKLQDALNTTLGFNATFSVNDLDDDIKIKFGPERVARYADAMRKMSPYAVAVKKIFKIGAVSAGDLPNLGMASGNGNVQLNKDMVEGKLYSSGFTDILVLETLWKEVTTNDLYDLLPHNEAEPLAIYLTSLVTKNKIKAGAEFQRTSSANQLRDQAIKAIPA